MSEDCKIEASLTAETRKVIEAIYAAAATHDGQAMVALLDENITTASAPYLPWGGPWRGRDEFLEKCVPQLAQIYDFSRMIVEELLVDGSRAVATVRCFVQASGEEVLNIEAWTVQKGRATDMRACCVDPRPLLRQLAVRIG